MNPFPVMQCCVDGIAHYLCQNPEGNFVSCQLNSRLAYACTIIESVSHTCSDTLKVDCQLMKCEATPISDRSSPQLVLSALSLAACTLQFSYIMWVYSKKRKNTNLPNMPATQLSNSIS